MAMATITYHFALMTWDGAMGRVPLAEFSAKSPFPIPDKAQLFTAVDKNGNRLRKTVIAVEFECDWSSPGDLHMRTLVVLG